MTVEWFLVSVISKKINLEDRGKKVLLYSFHAVETNHRRVGKPLQRNVLQEGIAVVTKIK